MRLFLVGVVVGTLLVLSPISFAQSQPSVQGVWKVSETTGGLGAADDKAVNSAPQPGYYIFTPGGHYSITRAYGDKSRLPPKDANNPTIAELTDANRFLAQFGTYEVKGDTITFRLSVARQPATMNAATPLTGSFKLDGKLLTLTLKSATTGAVGVVKLTRVE